MSDDDKKESTEEMKPEVKPAEGAQAEGGQSQEKEAGGGKPDLAELAKKIDINKILGGIKAMLNPEGEAEQADPNDALGNKVKELGELLKEVGKKHAELSKDFSKANDLVAALFKDVEALRAQCPKKEKAKSETSESEKQE